MKICERIAARINTMAAENDKFSDLSIITVAAHDIDTWLLHYMLLSVFRFTDIPPRIIICDNGRNGPLKKLYKDNKYISIVNRSQHHKNASVEHGIGLNRAFQEAVTPLTASIESDCILLDHGWDTITKGFNMMGVQKIKFIEKHGLRAYYPCFALFYTDIMKQNGVVDFKPDAGGKSKQGKDTGWRMSEKVSEDEVELLDLVSCKDSRCQYVDKSFAPNAFELHRNGKPLLAHIGRGSKAVRRGHDVLNRWKNKLNILFELNEHII